MKTIKHRFFFGPIIFVLLLSFSACEEFLDIDPKGYVIPSTVEDYSRLLNNETLMRFLPVDLDKLADSYYIANITANTEILTLDLRIYFWLQGMYLPEDYQYNSPWQQGYSVIYQYNAIIENIDAATDGTDAEKAEIKAIARAGRAFTYWYLVNLYAPTYRAETAATDLGLPLVLSANTLDASTLPARSSVADTYNFILTELTEAIPDLPEVASTIYNIHQTAAYAFLARTYLYMADYANAITAVDQVFERYSTVLNYNTIMTSSSTGTYSFNTASFSPLEDNPENIYVIMYTTARGMAYTQLSNEYYQIIAENESDLRRAFYSNLIYPQTYWDQYTNGTYTDNRPFNATIGPTVPEMLLIRAESNGRLGNTSGALADLNRLRENRFAADAYTPLESGDANDVVGWVLDERKRELVNKGLRWFDMRRLNSDPNFGFTGQRHLVDGTTIDLEPNSSRYILQIPDVALTENIVQNPI